VEGLHPELSAVAKGQGMDKHPLTKEQAEVEGIPQDQVNICMSQIPKIEEWWL
jgi:hypothetical protein